MKDKLRRFLVNMCTCIRSCGNIIKNSVTVPSAIYKLQVQCAAILVNCLTEDQEEDTFLRSRRIQNFPCRVSDEGWNSQKQPSGQVKKKKRKRMVQ